MMVYDFEYVWKCVLWLFMVLFVVMNLYVFKNGELFNFGKFKVLCEVVILCSVLWFDVLVVLFLFRGVFVVVFG